MGKFTALDYATGGALLPTVLADAVDLEGMPGGLIVMLSPDFLLQFVDLGRKEFYGTAAFRADHVMMTAAIMLVLKAGYTVVESNFAGKSTLCKQF